MAPRTRSSSAFPKPEIPDSDESSPSPAPAENVPPKRRGPSGKVTTMATASPLSTSSVPTPTTSYSSGSDHSTPLTSHVPTPAASGPAGESAGSSLQPRLGNSIEVLLPQYPRPIPTPDTHRVLRQSIFSMNPKRKRAGVDDSEDEDDSDNTADAQLARTLQDEEYNFHKLHHRSTQDTPNVKGAVFRPKKPISFGISDDDDDDVHGIDKYNVAKSKRRSNQDAPRVKESAPTPKNLSAFDLSGDDEEDLDKDDLHGIEKSNIVTGRRRSTRNATKAPPSSSIPGTLVASRAAKGPYIVEAPKPSHIDLTQSDDAGTALNSAEDDEYDEHYDSLDNYSGDDDDDDSASLSAASAAASTATSATAPTAARPHARGGAAGLPALGRRTRGPNKKKSKKLEIEDHHPELKTLWTNLRDKPIVVTSRAAQPTRISRQLKPFQLEGLAWMRAMEAMSWKGGILGDEMGLGKTIQAVSLIMSDWPAKQPSLVLVPPVAMVQWMSEINSYTDGTLKALFFHGTNAKAKSLTAKALKAYNVIVMSYNTLESMYRKQEKGFKRKDGLFKEESLMHKINFHRVILDEAHSIKSRSTMTAKACFALKTTYRWCLTGTPLQNRIGEFFSLVKFLNVQPFACYFCKQCPCSTLEWSVNSNFYCTECKHAGVSHISVFNKELLNPIVKYGNWGPGAEALQNLRLLTDRIMLRRLKKNHTDSMELPVKEIYVDRQFFGEEELDFAGSIMSNGQRRFDTYVTQGVVLNNYANIFGLIMQMRQVADHPDLILRKNSVGGQNVLGCCICDEPAEQAIRSKCKHDFCRSCVTTYLSSSDEPDCPRCHIPLSIDLEQPEIEQDEVLIKKSSIINRINMDNWTSSSKIELLVHKLHQLRSDNSSHKSIIFSQFTTMLQLIEWRLRRAGITTVMLDGSMTPAQRQASIDAFMKNPDVECFLVSMKAGGVALNLTEASYVFIVDPWWNPAAEWQSADRCHRINQNRPCTIIRLCIEDSVESRMVLLQEKKTNMINSTINSDNAAMDSLDLADLHFLFRGS